jgi:hypothetical protein
LEDLRKMIVNISSITSIINKVADLTSGDKTIPGLLLKIARDSDNISEGKLSVCYYDGHKALIEETEVSLEEEDVIGDIVFPFELLSRAISNCQPSGIIKVDSVRFEFLPNKLVRVQAEQSADVVDLEGNVVGSRKLAKKKMDIVWTEPGADMKSSLLARMNYSGIFENNVFDVMKKSEFIEALSKTSTEKGRNIYISSNVQSVFVSNQAHLTAVPISKNELTVEQMDVIRGEMVSNGEYTEEAYVQRIKEEQSKIHQSIVIAQPVAKSLIGILNKTKSDEICVYRDDKFCNVFIDNTEEKIGIWFAMAVGNKAHIGALERYSSLQYKSYQLLFLREFLENNIKSALNATKSEQVTIKFEATDLDNAASASDLVIVSGSAAASVNDVYRINPDEILDSTGDINTRTFSISLKVLADMLSQLKTRLVALDINVAENEGMSKAVSIRLAEVDDQVMMEEYIKAREELAKECELKGEVFDASSTPTPIEKKLNYRSNILKTTQYTMIGA